jgi:hypothetical protein
VGVLAHRLTCSSRPSRLRGKKEFNREGAKGKMVGQYADPTGLPTQAGNKRACEMNRCIGTSNAL